MFKDRHLHIPSSLLSKCEEGSPQSKYHITISPGKYSASDSDEHEVLASTEISGHRKKRKKNESLLRSRDREVIRSGVDSDDSSVSVSTASHYTTSVGKCINSISLTLEKPVD